MALLISAGMICSTSGMGIGATMGIWGLFLILRDERDGSFSIKNVFRKRNLIAAAILVVVFLVAVQNISFLRRAVTRIIVPGKTGSTAISGRTAKALELVSTMTVKQWFFGVADNTHGITFTVPGLLDVLYRHGLIGLILSYELYVKCIFKLKFSYKFIGVVILISSLLTGHTHSTVGMLYYVLVLMSGYHALEPDRLPIQLYTPAPKKIKQNDA